MSSEKIIKPLDELVRYSFNIPLIVESYPKIPINIIISEIKNIGGIVKGIFFRNNLKVELPLEIVETLCRNDNIKKIRFDGNYKLLRGNISEEQNKLDKYLTELICLLERTPIIIHTIDGLEEEDRVKVKQLGGTITDALKIEHSYSATLPLRTIEELAELPRVTGLSYEQRYGARSTTKTFLPSTFWVL